MPWGTLAVQGWLGVGEKGGGEGLCASECTGPFGGGGGKSMLGYGPNEQILLELNQRSASGLLLHIKSNLEMLAI